MTTLEAYAEELGIEETATDTDPGHRLLGLSTDLARLKADWEVADHQSVLQESMQTGEIDLF